MPHFMRQHVRLGELPGRLELIGKLLEEPEVQIHLAVARAVERSNRGVGRTAGGRQLIAVQHQSRRRVREALCLEDLTPGVLGLTEYRRNEAALFVLWRAARRGRAHGLLRGGYRAHQPHDEARIDAEEIRRGEGEQRPADAEAQARSAAAARGPRVFNVGAFAKVVPAHGANLYRILSGRASSAIDYEMQNRPPKKRKPQVS